ncbi:hypothetical protein SGLAM104S_01301 [Streptomyces glaucescens]
MRARVAVMRSTVERARPVDFSRALRLSVPSASGQPPQHGDAAEQRRDHLGGRRRRGAGGVGGGGGGGHLLSGTAAAAWLP